MDIVLGCVLDTKDGATGAGGGSEADGEIVDHDTFDVTPDDGSATVEAPLQVVAAVLGMLEKGARRRRPPAQGHRRCLQVTTTEAAKLRDELAAVLPSTRHSGLRTACRGARWPKTAGRAVGYRPPACCSSTATPRRCRSYGPTTVDRQGAQPQPAQHRCDGRPVRHGLGRRRAGLPAAGMFVVGSGVDVGSVKDHLQAGLVPVSAPDEPELALARGAALAAARTPRPSRRPPSASAYSQDPDGTTAGND